MEAVKGIKKGNDAECDTVKRQIEDVEGAVLKLSDTNDQLMKDLEESTPSLNKVVSAEAEKSRQTQRKRVAEQARRDSQEIGQLQFEVQNIQYVMLKLGDEKKSKGKSRFSGKTVVLLRDFIRSGKKSSSKKHKKGCFCGCSKPSTTE
ncbi:Protein NETWORKED 1B [Arachis hypogaea]|nr:Protein NETWORKED 1B [Arachis hypogaea]